MTKPEEILIPFFESKEFNDTLNGFRQGGWSPTAFFIDAEGHTLVVAIAGGGDPIDAIKSIVESEKTSVLDDDGLSKSNPTSRAVAVVTFAEVWMSENPATRPSADPKRQSAIRLTAHTIKDKTLVQLSCGLIRMAEAK